MRPLLPRLAALAALALVLAPRPAVAQLPTVQEVYDKYATAVGGRDAWRSVKGRTERGTADITFAGLSGSYTRHFALPNRLRLIIDLTVVTIDNGFDGEQGWESQGGDVTRMSSEQEADLREEHADGAHFLDPARYASAEVVARDTFEGADTGKVELTSRTGRKSTEYFDVNTGLRVGAVTTTAGGTQRVVFRDYKAFEGRSLPTRITQNSGQGDVVLFIDRVSFEVPDASLFKAPR